MRAFDPVNLLTVGAPAAVVWGLVVGLLISFFNSWKA